MSKYIDTEKLIAEIERLSSSEHPIEYELEEKLAYNRALDEIKDAITSLQQEQPEGGSSEKPNNLLRGQPEVDLDSALTGFMGRYAFENGGEYPSAIDIARHFAEWGAIHLNARKEE